MLLCPLSSQPVICRHTPCLLCCCFCSDPAADVSAFKSSGGHILIGTPGRLDDIMKRLGTALDTKQLEVLVSKQQGGGRGGGR